MQPRDIPLHDSIQLSELLTFCHVLHLQLLLADPQLQSLQHTTLVNGDYLPRLTFMERLRSCRRRSGLVRWCILHVPRGVQIGIAGCQDRHVVVRWSSLICDGLGSSTCAIYSRRVGEGFYWARYAGSPYKYKTRLEFRMRGEMFVSEKNL